jgi:hypothetical protein
MNRLLIRLLLVACVCQPASPLVSAAGTNCAAMEASGPKWFAGQLDAVQATYESGNSQGAWQQLDKAMISLPRTADVSLDARCAGPAGWQRMYELRKAITATLGKQSENIGILDNTGGALDWYVIGDNQDDARRVIKRLTPTAEGTAFIIDRLQKEVNLLDSAQESGFELLPDELSARKFWQKGLSGMIAYANKQVREILEKESGLLTRAATSNEEQFEAAQEIQQSLAANYLGDESLAVKNEAQREVNRAEASLNMLVAAREWSHAVRPGAAAPVIDRAVIRGDALLAQADDTDLGLETRDSLYQAAGNYFEFAGDSARLEALEQKRASIAPALKAERDARSARTKRKAAELQKSAEGSKKAIQKTDAQKKNFKDEADAMEDELGF